MNWKHQDLFTAWLERWKPALEDEDAPISGADMVESVCNLYRHYKLIETEVSQDTAIEEEYRTAAKEEHHKDGECEIDSNAVVSISDDGGAYVAAWVWVDGPVKGESYARCKTCGVILDDCKGGDAPGPAADWSCNTCFNQSGSTEKEI